MHLGTEAAKIRKALQEVELLMSSTAAKHADELARLHTFFILALSQVPTEPTAPSGDDQE